MYYYDIQQNTDEWFDIKRGKFSASMAAELLMKPNTVGYQKLINRIVFERVTNQSIETYSNNWMERGLELEAEAIKQYELETFNKVNKVGYVSMTDWIGCSPDGLIANDGLIQIKCLAWNTHLEYFFSDKVQSQYIKQCQFELYVTDRQYNILYCYHPGLKPIIKKIERNNQLINEIHIKLSESINLVDERIALLTK